MDRPYFDLTIPELEALVRKHASDLAVLGPVRVELEHRDKPRARQLLREVEALVHGQVPRPAKPPRPDKPEDQLGIFPPKTPRSQ